MSNLRDQLDRAQAEYHSAAYPGDLASELLTLRLTGSDTQNIARPVGSSAASSGVVTKNRWFWATGTGSAAAAALVGAFILSSSTTDIPVGPGSAGYLFSAPSGLSPRGPMVSVPATPNPWLLSNTTVPPAGDRFQLERNRNASAVGGIQMVDAPSTRPTGKDLSLQPHLRTLEYDRP